MGKWRPVWLAASFATALAMMFGCRSLHPSTGCCEDGCIAVPTTEKKSTWVYDCQTEPKCYLRPAHSLCDEGEPPTCGQAPRTVVIKRRVTTEVPAWKCEPASAEK